MIKVNGLIKQGSFHQLSNFENITNENCPSFSGIVTGECKGDLWVDDIDNPRISIVYSYPVGSFGFLGCGIYDYEYLELKKFIEKEIFDYIKDNKLGCFEFSVENEHLKPCILKMFENMALQSEKEYSYRRTEFINSGYTLPEGFEIKKADMDFLNKVFNGIYENEALLIDRILQSWDNIGSFIEKSLAFCIIYLKRIVAVTVGTARYKNVITVSIETEEKYRNKGLGYGLTVEFVNECARRGLTVQWDCMESNLASRKLAEKAGFKKFRENEVYWFDIN